MKRKLASAIVVIGLLASSMAPTSAVFGLSKCEKAEKQITNEEKVGVLLHRKYAEQRKIVLGLSTPTFNNLNTAMSWLPDVYDSDLRIYNLVNKNSSCFSSKQVARARSEARAAKKNISDIATVRKLLINNANTGQKSVDPELVKVLEGLYPNYYSFLSNKKLN